MQSYWSRTVYIFKPGRQLAKTPSDWTRKAGVSKNPSDLTRKARVSKNPSDLTRKAEVSKNPSDLTRKAGVSLRAFALLHTVGNDVAATGVLTGLGHLHPNGANPAKSISTRSHFFASLMPSIANRAKTTIVFILHAVTHSWNSKLISMLINPLSCECFCQVCVTQKSARLKHLLIQQQKKRTRKKKKKEKYLLNLHLSGQRNYMDIYFKSQISWFSSVNMVSMCSENPICDLFSPTES